MPMCGRCGAHSRHRFSYLQTHFISSIAGLHIRITQALISIRKPARITTNALKLSIPLSTRHVSLSVSRDQRLSMSFLVTLVKIARCPSDPPQSGILLFVPRRSSLPHVHHVPNKEFSALRRARSPCMVSTLKWYAVVSGKLEQCDRNHLPFLH